MKKISEFLLFAMVLGVAPFVIVIAVFALLTKQATFHWR